MYTAFYGLREKPFALSPDPRFLYLAGSHREALAHLLYGIEQGEGFISVTGEVGTGKTTLCRTLLERLDGDTELAFLFNPSRTALELLQSICAEFGLPAEGLARRALMHQLNTFLLEQKRRGKRVLLIIDEAQTLSENTLEQVRLLSNLETSRDKLIQILLLGQPELDRKLDERGLRQLRQRISVRWKLDPLSPAETRAYVRHRLSVAAGEPKDLFSEAALKEVHRRTGGVPRLVNQLCDRALLAGYAARAAKIGPRLVREAAREIPDARLRHERSGPTESGGRLASFFRPWMFVAFAALVVGGALYAGLQVGRSGLLQPMTAALSKDDREREAGPGEGGLPAVGAPAPTRPISADNDITVIAPDGRVVSRGAPSAGGPGNENGSGDGPTVVELIGYMPGEVRDQLVDPEATARAEEALRAGLSGASEPVGEAALSPGLLAQLLERRAASAALAETHEVVLDRFGRAVDSLADRPRDPNALQRAFESRGLTATPFDGGSLALLRRLDHPFAIPLAASVDRGADERPSATTDRQRWLAVIGFEDDRARVAGLVPGQVVTVTVDDLEAHWLETGIVVWERFEPVPPVLTIDDEGQGVRWLQRGLAELRFFEGALNSRYDDATTEAVRRLQVDAGLVADGVAGPLTQIALYAGMTRYPVPRLSERAPSPLARDARPVRADRATESTPASPPEPNAPGGGRG
ncbi:MAG: AAA family ATPase [bacterium]|nr:AAA family ATPase [bacterium]